MSNVAYLPPPTTFEVGHGHRTPTADGSRLPVTLSSDAPAVKPVSVAAQLGDVQVIPAEEVNEPAPQWDSETTVTITEPDA